ncbi:unnamed protein product [Paramecium octaurelia]|uniref:Protein kinase domain-containing protein n=1 Tax=Paramecium octaurelia TaxID=43137 RepID=A0A8S1XJ57_PAROT|nr:unnamed protein product [Paramecium octaurelia]
MLQRNRAYQRGIRSSSMDQKYFYALLYFLQFQQKQLRYKFLQLLANALIKLVFVYMSNPQFKPNPQPLQFKQPQQQNFQFALPKYETITIDAKTYKKFQPPLGEGSEGIVYKGQNVQTNEPVAIKEYKQINANELKAIQAIQRYKFNKIIGIIGVQLKPNGLPIVVMEFAHGEFYQYMQTPQYTSLSYDQKNAFFVQMLKALQQLHQLKLFHRDMKPENFVYFKGPNNKITIKLIDFGLVSAIGNGEYTAKVGTPYYMAPEVLPNFNEVINKHQYDKSVDIWSLGAIWYELLTNETFFQGNSQEEIFFQIKTIKQDEIDRKIQNNNKIGTKEKNNMKIMLNIDPQVRLSKNVLIEYIKEIRDMFETFIQEKLKIIKQDFEKKLEAKKSKFDEDFHQFKSKELGEVKIKKQQQFKQTLKLLKSIENKSEKKKIKLAFQIKNQEKQINIENQIERKLQEYGQQIDDKLKNVEFLKQMLEEMDEKEQNFLLNFDNNLMHVQEQDENPFLMQQEIQCQEEMEQYKKQKDEELNKYFQRFIQQEKEKIIEFINESVELYQLFIEELRQSIVQEIESWKYQEKEKERLIQELEIEKKRQEKEKQIEFQQLEEKKQLYIIQLESIQTPIQGIISYLTEKEQIINKINLQDKKKSELLTYINDEIKKFEEIFLKNENRKKLILQAQTQQMLKEYSELAKENEQYLIHQKQIIEKITLEQGQLGQQLKDKEKFDLQEEKKKMELEQKLKIEQEQKQKKEVEKASYQSLLTQFQKQCENYSLQIQQISEKLTFYQRIQVQIQKEEEIQNAIKYHQQITQDIQNVEFQEKLIQKCESLQQQISTYQSCISQLKEIQQAQIRLNSQIGQANKCIQQIEIEYLDQHKQQIEELNDKLIDYQDKYKYLPQNQKYKNQITQIINQIGQTFGYLDDLKLLLTQGTFVAYQKYTQINQQLEQSLKSFEKQYYQIHEQIYKDLQFDEKNEEKVKKLEMTKDQLNNFIIKMNQLKDQVKNLISNQYCNNQKTQNLIQIKLTNIDQNIMEQQVKFDKFTELNQLDSCENIIHQIKQLEEFSSKLKEVEVNEIEQINELELIIKNVGEESKQKSDQEKEILTLNNQLSTRFREYTTAIQSIKFSFENLEIYKKINQQTDNLKLELNNEIQTLNDYISIQSENMQILEEELKNKQKKKGKTLEYEIQIKKYQQISNQKGQILEQITNKVTQKTKQLTFCFMDQILINNYEQLKMQEVQLSINLTSINQKIFNQQLNPQQLNELKEYILKVYNEIDELMKKIPMEDQIKEFNKAYQQNLESYEKVYTLINYIKQYHLTRYYERIKDNANFKKKQNNKESDYQKQFQSKLTIEEEENTKREKEAQDIFLRYEHVLFKYYNKMTIDVMEKNKESIEKQLVEVENLIKQRNLVKIRSKMKDQTKIKEIMNIKQYYKISEFTQGHILKALRSDDYNKN